MLNNRFIYQNTGILDHTHITHFTYSELETMCMDSGYGVVYMDGVYIAVGKNEFDISYADVEPEIAQLLKKRPLGELYQHIIEIKKKEYLKNNPQKIDNRLGNRKDFTVLCEEQQDVVGVNEELTNDRIIKILCENPNYFFETNDELCSLRTHINELYAANTDLQNVEALRTRIQEYQEEVREKNKHIQELLSEEEKKSQRIVELQIGEEERNNHIKRLDEEIVQLNRSLEEKVRELSELMENERWNSAVGQEYIATLKQNILELQEAILDRGQILENATLSNLDESTVRYTF